MTVGSPKPRGGRRCALQRIGAIAFAGPAGGRVWAADPTPPPLGDLLRTGLYRLHGEGGNTLMRYTAAGIVLVDGQPASGHKALMTKLRRINRIGDQPLRLLLLTSARERHSGSAGLLAAARVPVMAQQRTRARLLARGDIPEAALHAFDDERELRIGGIALALRHWGPAVTDGDAVVHFKDQGVMAVGDLYSDGAPQPDFRLGGSWVGWSATLQTLLKLEFDTVVPGDGAALPRTALESFAARFAALLNRARALVAAGATPTALAARLVEADAGWGLAFSQGAARLHAELAAAAD